MIATNLLGRSVRYPMDKVSGEIAGVSVIDGELKILVATSAGKLHQIDYTRVHLEPTEPTAPSTSGPTPAEIEGNMRIAIALMATAIEQHNAIRALHEVLENPAVASSVAYARRYLAERLELEEEDP